MGSTDTDKQKPAEDDLRKTVEDLKKAGEGARDRGDMPADSSLGHPEIEKGGDKERLPPDDDEN